MTCLRWYFLSAGWEGVEAVISLAYFSGQGKSVRGGMANCREPVIGSFPWLGMPCSSSSPHPRLPPFHQPRRGHRGGVEQVVVFGRGERDHFVEQLLLTRVDVAGAASQAERAVFNADGEGVDAAQ